MARSVVRWHPFDVGEHRAVVAADDPCGLTKRDPAFGVGRCRGRLIAELADDLLDGLDRNPPPTADPHRSERLGSPKKCLVRYPRLSGRLLRCHVADRLGRPLGRAGRSPGGKLRLASVSALGLAFVIPATELLDGGASQRWAHLVLRTVLDAALTLPPLDDVHGYTGDAGGLRPGHPLGVVGVVDHVPDARRGGEGRPFTGRGHSAQLDAAEAGVGPTGRRLHRATPVGLHTLLARSTRRFTRPRIDGSSFSPLPPHQGTSLGWFCVKRRVWDTKRSSVSGPVLLVTLWGLGQCPRSV